MRTPTTAHSVFAVSLLEADNTLGNHIWTTRKNTHRNPGRTPAHTRAPAHKSAHQYTLVRTSTRVRTSPHVRAHQHTRVCSSIIPRGQRTVAFQHTCTPLSSLFK